MINIRYNCVLVVSISLLFLIFSQIPNSYSKLDINENFIDTYEIQEESEVTHSNNNNEDYFDNDSNYLETDNFNNENLYPYLDNSKSTNNNISNQESSLLKVEGIDNNNAEYKENISYSSVNDTDNDSFNQKKSEIVIKKANVDENNKLVVVSKINLQNISKTGMIKVIGVINGEDFVKNIPLDKLKDSAKKLMVKFEMNKDNEFVSASKPDEFFVCAYHVTNSNNNNYNNKIQSVSVDKQNDATTIDYFDCNEGDIQSTSFPTKANLFTAKSQVYNKTAYYYNMYSKDQVTYFATMDDDDTTTKSTTTSNSLLNSDVKQYNKKQSNAKDVDSNKPVQVKILVPMEDKKNAKKIKIMAMLKGQIKSEIIDNVQEEFKKIGGYTIERTFAFDRNTDMGPIQIGDRFHACVIGQDLNPPEGSECEKKLIKYLDKPNSLAAR